VFAKKVIIRLVDSCGVVAVYKNAQNSTIVEGKSENHIASCRVKHCLSICASLFVFSPFFRTISSVFGFKFGKEVASCCLPGRGVLTACTKKHRFSFF